MIKNKLLLLLGLAIFISCTTTRNNATTEKVQSPMEAICSCQNSKGKTIDAYAQKEQKRMGFTQEKYIDFLRTSKSFMKADNWLFNAFIEDEAYLKNLKAVATKLKQEKEAFGTPKDLEMIEQEYPFCLEALPYFSRFLN